MQISWQFAVLRTATETVRVHIIRKFIHRISGHLFGGTTPVGKRDRRRRHSLSLLCSDRSVGRQKKISDPFTLNIMNIPVFFLVSTGHSAQASPARSLAGCIRWPSSSKGRLSLHKYRQQQGKWRITES